MDASTIASIERATLAAVPPAELLEQDGWLVALDPGTVGRAHSAVPTRHADVPLDALPAIFDAYAERQLKPAFRVADVPGVEPLRRALAARGLHATQPTLVMTGEAQGLLALVGAAHVHLAVAPDAPWSALFLGPGFDPADAASRLAILQRSRGTLFGSVRQGDDVVAVGTTCFAQGWCGIHGMRTAPAARRQGLAGAILAAFAREALARGIARVMLQVEERNEAARALYTRGGLRVAWRYAYWRPA